ncbi:MAG: hypothetical protein HY717_01010 [Planctomycetes bacterium]|nr:hypothetical protein [Planctomycetota bacterium]
MKKLAISVFSLLLGPAGGLDPAFGQNPFPIEEKLDPPKLAEPDLSAQKSSEAMIKGLFKEDYARKAAADKAILARKLLEKGKEPNLEAAERYVLYREARDLAVQAGEVELALEALRELRDRYQVRDLELTAATLAALAKNARSPEAPAALAQAHLDFGRMAVLADDYKLAGKAAGEAAAYARRGQEAVLAIEAEELEKEVDAIEREYQALKPSEQSLPAGSEDAQACLAAGRFRCLFKGDFKGGLPLLAKGADPALKDLAAKDLAGPGDDGARVEAGDAWWSFSEREKSLPRRRAMERAVFWYEKAFPSLSGLLKARLEKRLAQYAAELRPQKHWSDVFGQTGNENKNNIYTFELKPKGKTAILRFWATSPRKMDSYGEVTLNTPQAKKQAVHKWTPRDFKVNFEKVSSYKDLKPFTIDISRWVAAPGSYDVHFQYKTGRDALKILRVEILVY